MEKTIINPWKNPNYGTGRDYTVYTKPVFTYKGHEIYKLTDHDYLYVHNGIAFSELAGLNKKHLMDIADGTGWGCMYCRALERLTLNKQLAA